MVPGADKTTDHMEDITMKTKTNVHAGQDYQLSE
jgi:hypothetical protein